MYHGTVAGTFQAIVKSNGWSPTTAALQLCAHLDGNALNVDLLMPVEEREQWTAFARGLSGRLAVVRQRFESASRRPGVDPATFAKELGIPAVCGFENMDECARDLMVRKNFNAAQQSRALRRHMDGASVEASIGDIVDSCRVWESHTEAGYNGPDLKFSHTISQVAEEAQPPLRSIASDPLQKSTGLLLPMQASAPPGVTRSSADCDRRLGNNQCPGISLDI